MIDWSRKVEKNFGRIVVRRAVPDRTDRLSRERKHAMVIQNKAKTQRALSEDAAVLFVASNRAAAEMR